MNGPKKSKKLPHYFEYNELEELFNVPDISTPIGQRDRLLLEMLYATGVRVGELVNIKVHDIDVEERIIKVFGKGSKERFVFFTGNHYYDFEEYLNYYGGWGDKFGYETGNKASGFGNWRRKISVSCKFT